MTSEFPTADEYSSEKARHPPLAVVDIRAEQAAVTEPYRNQVLFDIDEACMRLAVFEGEYRWHHHPDSDELFLVVAGELQIDFEDGARVTLTEWQAIVVPAGTVHRTRASGRTCARCWHGSTRGCRGCVLGCRSRAPSIRIAAR